MIFRKGRFLSPIASSFILISAIGQLLATMSMSALIGCGAGVLVLGLAYASRRQLRSRLSILFGISVISFIVMAQYFPVISTVTQGLYLKFSIRAEQANIIFGRDRYFEVLPKVLENSYGMGVGYGGLSDFVNDSISTMHSAYLTVLGEQGIPSFLVLITFTLVVFMRLMKQAKQTGALAIGLAAAFLSLVASNLGYDAMFSFDSSWVLIGLAAATASLQLRQVAG